MPAIGWGTLLYAFAIDWVMAHEKHLVLAFLDLKKAFDKVPRALLFRVSLEWYGVDANMVEVLWHLYSDVVGLVVWDSATFAMMQGV